MIAQELIDRILRGEKLRLMAYEEDLSILDNFKAWLQQFQSHNCGKNAGPNCNIHIRQRGGYKITIWLGELPFNQLVVICATLSSCPFSIGEIRQKN
jgi:hypothetical protein